MKKELHFKAKERRIQKTISELDGSLSALSQINKSVQERIERQTEKLKDARKDLINNAFFLYRDELQFLFKQIKDKVFLKGRRRYIKLKDLRSFVGGLPSEFQPFFNDFACAVENPQNYFRDSKKDIRLSIYEKTFLSKFVADGLNIKKTLDSMARVVYGNHHETN